MADLSEILRLLETERSRYVLEAAELERRLSFIRNQIQALEALLSGYAVEEQMYPRTQQHLLDVPSTQQTLVEQTVDVVADNELETQPLLDSNVNASEPDISDIPKLTTSRQPGSIPMLPKFREYSIKNAILILMRHLADRQIHIDAITRDLYGNNLTPRQFQTVKATVSKMLSEGKQAKLWYGILGAPGVYTLNYERGVTTEPPKYR